MLTKTPAFVAAEQAGYLPLFYVYANTDIAQRCFYLKGSPAVSSGTGLWDGSGYVGDGGTFGADIGTVQTRPLLIANPVVNKTSTKGSRGLLTAISSGQVGHVGVDLDNLYKEDGRYYFSQIITGVNPEIFLNQPLEVRVGFQGLDYADQLSLFRGTITDTPLNGPVFKLGADGITSTLYDVWEVPKSSRYTNPSQDNQAIPVVLGDMTENAYIDEDGDGVADKGPIPLVCIDTVNDVWAMACHPLLTTGNGQVVTLYDDDGVIAGGDYVYTASGDYESAGLDIAYVTFSTPPSGTVTGKYKGAPDDSGALVTNPVECLSLLLTIMGEDTDFEITAYQRAVSDADDQGYTCAGLILADNSKAYWLGNILSNFIGSWFLNEDNEIVLQLDTAQNNFLNTAGHLYESKLKGHLKLNPTIDNLITRPIINYAISYAKIDRRFKNDTNASYLQTYADTEQADDISEPIDFDWVRNEDTVAAISTWIEDVYSPLKLYTGIKTTDFSLIHFEPGDFFSFGSQWQYDDAWNSLCGQIGRVLNITIDGKNREISLDFYDTGAYLLEDPDIWNGDGFVGDGGTFGGDRKCVLPLTQFGDTSGLIHDGTYEYDGDKKYDGLV